MLALLVSFKLLSKRKRKEKKKKGKERGVVVVVTLIQTYIYCVSHPTGVRDVTV